MYTSCVFRAHESTDYICTESAWASALLILCWGQCEGLNCGISDRCSSHVFVFIWSYQFIIYSFIKTLCVGNLQALNNVICKKLILFPQHGFGLIFGRRFCFPCYALQLFLVATNCVWYSPKDRKDLLGSRLTKYRWTR